MIYYLPIDVKRREQFMPFPTEKSYIYIYIYIYNVGVSCPFRMWAVMVLHSFLCE